MKYTHQVRGFTLIELLVVISIVSLISSVVYSSASGGRAKAEDAKKIVETRQVETALRVFTEERGRPPLNYGPEHIAVQGDGNYEKSMQELVDAGYFNEIPASSDPNNPYVYSNFEDQKKVLFGTSLKNTKGNSASCSFLEGEEGGDCVHVTMSYCFFAEIDQDAPPDEVTNTCGVEYSDGSQCSYGINKDGYVVGNPCDQISTPRMEYEQVVRWDQGGTMYFKNNLCWMSQLNQPCLNFNYSEVPSSCEIIMYGVQTGESIGVVYFDLYCVFDVNLPAAVCEPGPYNNVQICDGSSDSDFCVCVEY